MKTTDADSTVTKRKNILFKVISVLLPFIFLLIVEVLLRVMGYGTNLDLFVEYPQDKSFLMFNPHASKRYFVDADLATIGNAELFKKVKDTNTLRIFILGESTTIGFPYFHNGSFHRLLQYRLMNTFPGKQLEIVNLGLTAVNSYTVRGFAKELPKYKPDAILIYSGHNEYYGTLGVASTENIGDNAWMINTILYLRDWRLVQWMTHVFSKFGDHSRDAGTRMKLMVGQELIPFDSRIYKKGIEQFASNMETTVKIFHASGIPVFISNLVSNEKDMRPFISETVDSVRYPGFHATFRLAKQTLENGDSARAYGLFKEANEIYPKHAQCNYYLGQLAKQAGSVTDAKKYFVAARDLDGLRFRAPSAMNEVIANLCNKYANVHLVDAQGAFENWTDDHIIGSTLLLEHVHPNLIGYGILSDAFYQTMKKENMFPLMYAREMTFDQFIASMPVAAVDSLAGIYRVTNLKRSWPFNETFNSDAVTVHSPEEKLALQLAERKIDWQVAMDESYKNYISTGHLAKAERIVEGMVLEHPTETPYWVRAATLNAKMGNKPKAITYFAKAFDLSPTFETARFLFVLYLQSDKPFEALPYISYGIKHNESRFNLQQLKDQVEDIVRIKETLKSDSMNVKVIRQLAKAYDRMDNLDGASKYVQKALKIDNSDKETLLLSSDIERKRINL